MWCINVSFWHRYFASFAVCWCILYSASGTISPLSSSAVSAVMFHESIMSIVHAFMVQRSGKKLSKSIPQKQTMPSTDQGTPLPHPTLSLSLHPFPAVAKVRLASKKIIDRPCPCCTRSCQWRNRNTKSQASAKRCNETVNETERPPVITTSPPVITTSSPSRSRIKNLRF